MRNYVKAEAYGNGGRKPPPTSENLRNLRFDRCCLSLRMQSRLKYIAYADRLKKTGAYWKLKIACTMKGSTKRPTMVSVCLIRMDSCLIMRSDVLHSG